MFDFWRASATAFDAMSTSLLHTLLPPLEKALPGRNLIHSYEYNMEQFVQDVERQLRSPLHSVKLLQFSQRLQNEYQVALRTSTVSMLPSYNHTLPSGNETGQFLTLDVGGSTFRVALIELRGRRSPGPNRHILHLKAFRIEERVRQLEGVAFFDWMASRIAEVLADPAVCDYLGSSTLSTGMAWSFPIEQTSIRSGSVSMMGKGFRAAVGVLGQDLSELLMMSCRKLNLNVKVDAIINDGTATLLSRAYDDCSTRLALILGTGTNAAIHLPVGALSHAKYGQRPDSWHAEAKHVLVNTEVSMFGKNILPTTRWDEHLNKMHVRPDFQPLEHLVSGRYLGEIARLILIEAVQVVGLFGGEIPAGLLDPYSLDTGLLACFESDTTARLCVASAAFQKAHALSTPPSKSELHYIRRIARAVSHRAAAYLATAIHGLWALRLTAEGIVPANASHVDIGCNGSVIEHYPSFMSTCQTYINELATRSGADSHSVTLEIADESALYGAAVAVAVSCLLDKQPVL